MPLNKLINLESQTVSEFIIPRRNHKIKKCRLCKEAQRRLIKIELYDYDEFYSVHIGGIKRL